MRLGHKLALILGKRGHCIGVLSGLAPDNGTAVQVCMQGQCAKVKVSVRDRRRVDGHRGPRFACKGHAWAGVRVSTEAGRGSWVWDLGRQRGDKRLMCGLVFRPNMVVVVACRGKCIFHV